MKLTNLQLINSEQVLVKLKAQELPIKVAYKLNKAIKEIAEKINFINEQKNEFIKKYGKEENGNYSIAQDDRENIDLFLRDFKEVLSIEEEVNIEPFDLKDFENVMLSSEDFEMISFLFE